MPNNHEEFPHQRSAEGDNEERPESSQSKTEKVIRDLIKAEQAGFGFRRSSTRFLLQVVQNVNPDDAKPIQEELHDPKSERKIFKKWKAIIKNVIRKIEENQ
jgi:hypothetical protein